MRTTPWTLDELDAKAREALERSDYVPAASARVRALPDRRTIRYYTTLGLLDRAEQRGRVAYYGRRHLLQLVAIKRLQGEGLSLSDVQERLAGLDDAGLERLADLPPPASPSVEPAAPEPEQPRRPARRSAGFWLEAPAQPTSPAPAQPNSPAPAPPPPSPERPIPAPTASLLPFQGLPLAAGVTLLLEGRAPVSAADVAQLRAAAAPLLAEL